MQEDEFVRRLQADVVDSYDEELELELEDRPFDAEGMVVALDAAEKQARRDYFRELLRLQFELVKLQDYVVATGHKMVILFEGRDAAGKGGVIKRITQRLNPRVCRVAALPAPNDRERTQWYFQRYIAHLPAAGEIVLFDRSWTTAPASNASWVSATTSSTRSSSAPCRSSRRCSIARASSC